MTRITSAVSLALLLATAACTTKKPVAQPAQPAAPQPGATQQDVQPAPGPQTNTPPKAPPGARKSSDPCSGGEQK